MIPLISTIQTLITGYTCAFGEGPEVILLHPGTWLKIKDDVISSGLTLYPSGEGQESIMGVPVLTNRLCPEDVLYLGKKVTFDVPEHLGSLSTH